MFHAPFHDRPQAVSGGADGHGSGEAVLGDRVSSTAMAVFLVEGSSSVSPCREPRVIRVRRLAYPNTQTKVSFTRPLISSSMHRAGLKRSVLPAHGARCWTGDCRWAANLSRPVRHRAGSRFSPRPQRWRASRTGSSIPGRERACREQKPESSGGVMGGSLSVSSSVCTRVAAQVQPCLRTSRP